MSIMGAMAMEIFSYSLSLWFYHREQYSLGST